MHKHQSASLGPHYPRVECVWWWWRRGGIGGTYGFWECQANTLSCGAGEFSAPLPLVYNQPAGYGRWKIIDPLQQCIPFDMQLIRGWVMASNNIKTVCRGWVMASYNTRIGLIMYGGFGIYIWTCIGVQQINSLNNNQKRCKQVMRLFNIRDRLSMYVLTIEGLSKRWCHH